MFFTSLIAIATLISQVTAHGYVPQIKIGSQYIPGWDISKNPYTTPQPLRVVRGTKLVSLLLNHIKLPPGPIQATVAAGVTVTMLWNTWPLGHYGPVDCSTFKGDTGSPWFKIQQDVYKNGVWASDTLATSNFTYVVNIPKNIAVGSYLLRHENLALHAASSVGGAQFYPACVQLTVTGGGSLQPSGLSFPGTYTVTDPGIHFNVYQGDAVNQAYVPPGGAVFPGLN
ncbi:glycoside hydrolase [Mycena floridula]|nr:glycoside hydrolase [Mycena floridula]